MSGRLQVLLPSDVFPPRCGGAGWSAHTLARALIERGHAVTAIVPQPARAGAAPHNLVAEHVLGVPTVYAAYWAPNLPFVQNYFRYERFWPRLADTIVRVAEQQAPHRQHQARIIHAQHVQAAQAAVLAGRRLGVPVVITVRDHWPWDYFSTGLHANRLPYANQTWASLAADLPVRLGVLRGTLALVAMPYMLAHMRRRRQALRQADAVIAVSAYMAGRLARAVPEARIHVLPNMVDLAAIDATLATPQASVPAGTRYLLFVGKLEQNKGAQLLVEIFRAAHRQQPRTPLSARWSLVVAGDGPLRPMLERELAALGIHAHFLGWVPHDEVLRLIGGCELLLFPSAWGEPLSRVPLEAGACGAAMLAMPTGGTPDIISDGVNGALEPTVGGFARRMVALLADPAGRRRLGAAARQVAEQRFSKAVLAQQAEELYHAVCAAAPPAASSRFEQ